MINKDMNELNELEQSNKKETESSKKPNEVGGFYFSSSIKIFDPNTKEVMVQQRGDN
jgi:hypothetical protein